MNKVVCELCRGTSPERHPKRGKQKLQKYYKGFRMCGYCYATLLRVKLLERNELRVVALYYKLITKSKGLSPYA